MPESTGNGADSHANSDTASDRTAPRSATRRRLLAASGGAAATLLAGCSSVVPEQAENLLDDGSGEGGGSGGEDSETATGTPTETPTPETDVVGLVTKQRDGGSKLFVTLSPPENGGGADWWQLETFGGDRITRISFDEPRTDDRFTTTSVVDPDDSKVVIRGHDVEYGYGGQVILADLEAGDLTNEKQGDEPNDFESYEF
jgi:hypothetical protein